MIKFPVWFPRTGLGWLLAAVVCGGILGLGVGIARSLEASPGDRGSLLVAFIAFVVAISGGSWIAVQIERHYLVNMLGRDLKGLDDLSVGLPSATRAYVTEVIWRISQLTENEAHALVQRHRARQVSGVDGARELGYAAARGGRVAAAEAALALGKRLGRRLGWASLRRPDSSLKMTL